MTKIVMENNGAVQKVMIPEFLGLLACYAMLGYSYMALWHDDKMDGYRAPCLDNAYHLMATW